MAETSWYYYDWQMDGDPAEFAVDTRFFDKAPYENRRCCCICAAK